jgi:hypothetical protein
MVIDVPVIGDFIVMYLESLLLLVQLLQPSIGTCFATGCAESLD